MPPSPSFLYHLSLLPSLSIRSQLSRLTVLIAKYLSVSLPFRLDIRPSHCVVYGGGKEGGREYSLSPPPNGNEILDDEQWARHHRHALYLLAMNVRHIMLTQ
eukprot:759740-Hanusia_phi.AAC.1